MKTRSKWAKQVDLRNKIIVRVLFFLNSFLWLIYTVYIYFDMAVLNGNEFSADVATIYAFINSALMFVSGIVLRREKPPSFYFSLVIVLFNTILTVFDLSDLIFVTAFVLNIAILWLLISLRRVYLSKP
jgi:hypothetical protein